MLAKGTLRTRLGGLVGTATAALLAAGGAAAQQAPTRPQVMIPQSGLEQPGDIGNYAHTNVEIFAPPGGLPSGISAEVAPQVGPPFTGYLFETPASLACAYGLVTVASGCNPYIVKTNPTGGSRAIAIVDAYNYPTAAADLAFFDKQFGVAAANFTVIYGTASPSKGCVNGAKPATAKGTGWDVEESLDIEWAHAMAPLAHIYLVEAATNSFANLLNAEQVAVKCVQAHTAGQVSNSWGGSEFSAEKSYDHYFTGTNVVFFAAAGDYFYEGKSASPGVLWPAASPNVIGVGGTAFSRNQFTGKYQSQATWANEDFYYYEGSLLGQITALGTGGGPSVYEPRPSWQNGISTIVGNVRGTPDLGGIADPATGVWVYNTTSVGGWTLVGGTSLATPVTAGIYNKLGLFYASGTVALTALYDNTGSVRSKHVTPVLNGDCGPPGNLSTGAYGGGYGQPYDPTWIYDTTHIAWGWCDGWGSIGH